MTSINEFSCKSKQEIVGVIQVNISFSLSVINILFIENNFGNLAIGAIFFQLCCLLFTLTGVCLRIMKTRHTILSF